MAIVNTGFSASPKVKCLEQSPQNFQFCISIEMVKKLKIWLSAVRKFSSLKSRTNHSRVVVAHLRKIRSKTNKHNKNDKINYKKNL